MKNLFLIIILFLISIKSTIAQPILFKNEKVDTIIIVGGEHHYAYGDAQTNKEDKLVIAYSEKRKAYRIINYERIIRDYPANYGSPKVTKKSKPTFIGRKKLQSNLNLLIENIDTSYFPIQITDYYKKRKIQRKITFWKVLKAYKREREIEEFFDVEMAYDYYKECKKLDGLDSMLTFRYSYDIIMTHTNSLDIEIKTVTNTYIYGSSTPDVLQPFYLNNTNKRVVNINISIALLKILPKGFVERKSLLLNDLIESYIHWKI